jgi:two-component system, cell cycle response regulator
MKILLADHDVVSRLLLTRFLGACGHQVVLADDGIQAMAVLQREDTPDIAILDATMSGMNGFDICRELRHVSRMESPYLMLLSPPKVTGEEAVEVFEADADDYLFRPVDVATVKARLTLAARVMELQQRCARALNPETERDLLTGAWSRLAILDFLRAQFARSARDGVSMAVILGDMDQFYAANSKFGQAACDAVLRETVKRITGAVRLYDSVGRYGGEEFLIIAPDCTMTNGYALAERLRAKIADEPFQVENKNVHMTISFGVATTAETGALDEEGLVRSADSALFTAKEHGRNRVETAKRIARHRSSQPRFLPPAKSKELVQ